MNFHPGMTLAHTAGAFRDCTRIANINAGLWTELLLENRDHTIMHLDAYISNLQKVRTALDESDDETLFKLLDTACRNKKEMLTR